MKKTILTSLITACVATGAFAQGSISGLGNIFNATALTFGLAQGNPNNATAYYNSATFNISVYYAATANVTAGQITAINALNGTSNGGATAFALLGTDGFTLQSATTLATSSPTAGAVSASYNGNQFTTPNQINLINTPTLTTAWLAFYIVSTTVGTSGWSDVVAFSSNTGGNPYAATPGTPQVLAKDPWGATINPDLTTAPVPEPTTLALAGLSGAALLAIRRRKA